MPDYHESDKYRVGRKETRDRILREFGPRLKQYTSADALVKNPLHAVLRMTKHKTGYRIHFYDGPLTLIPYFGKRIFVGVNLYTFDPDNLNATQYMIVESSHRDPTGSWSNKRLRHFWTTEATKDQALRFLDLQLKQHLTAAKKAKNSFLIGAGLLTAIFTLAHCPEDKKPHTPVNQETIERQSAPAPVESPPPSSTEPEIEPQRELEPGSKLESGTEPAPADPNP
ncbi:MAG: hypothetical protein DYH13_08490 [Alphaproteobacteria bacterium PRO2]|nr:hypothetical protein [Alphaproteobacteria bacterium PRO2]